MSDDLQDLEALKELKKDDVIIRFGIPYKIFKVEEIELEPEKKDEEPRKDKVIHFEPIYKDRRNETLRLSIPMSGFEKTTIREPINKTSMREELKFLRKGDYQRTPFNRTKVKRMINSNHIHDVARVLKTLWEENRDEDRNYTISKRNTFKMVFRRFHHEAAHVLEMTLDEAEDKVKTALDTGWSRQQRLREEEAEKENDED